LEGFSRELIRDLGEEGLKRGFSASEGVEANGVGVKIDLAADEPMRPEGIDREGMSEQTDLTVIVGASEEDDLAGRVSLEARLPRMWEGLPERGGQDTLGGAGACGSDEPGGVTLKGFQGQMVEASPDLGLPAAVVAFDGGLEAGFSRWRKDRSDLQGQAQASHSAEVIGVVVGALEPGVVIELGVARQAHLSPVLDQGEVRQFCRDGGSWPGGGQAAVKRDGVENLDIDSAFNDKASDDVEAIGFNPAGGELGQVPAAWRGWTPNPSFAVKRSSSIQDATDGANRGDTAMSSLDQFSLDGDITELSQIAYFFELLAKSQDLFFDEPADPIGRTATGSRRPVRPVHSLQLFGSGAANPSAHRGEAHPKARGHSPDRSATTHGPDDVSTQPYPGVFLNPCFLLSDESRRSHLSDQAEPPADTGPRPVEADGIWKAAEYGAFPHPLENATRFPQLPQVLTATTR
jgi:hypothetical protein